MKYDWYIIQQYYDQGHTFRECMAQFGFHSLAWNKAVKRGNIKTRPLKHPIKDLLTNGVRRRSSHLKSRLIKEGLIEEKCNECNLGPIWNNKPLSLQLEHKNGNVKDNRLLNLCLLCPNCHTQTPTFGSKNKNWKLSYSGQQKPVHGTKWKKLSIPLQPFSRRLIVRTTGLEPVYLR